MIDTLKLTEILSDAVSNFAANAGEKTPAEWLQEYLGEMLPNKTIDTIHTISSEILATLDVIEEKKAALNAAVENGESAENWLSKDVMKAGGGNGEIARMAAQFFNGIKKAETSYDEVLTGEIIDIDGEVWLDDDWNDYRLKDTLKKIAIEAAGAGLREIAAEAFIKAATEGVPAVFEDSEFIQQSLEKGAIIGLKAAVSAGLAIAEESGVIPPTSAKVITAIAHNTVENFIVFREVAEGTMTMTEALIQIKNSAVSTFSAMWQEYRVSLTDEITNAIGTAFGIKGAVISGAVIGFVTSSEEENRVKNAIKGVAKAALSFQTKDIEIPVFNEIKNTLTTTIDNL